MDLMPRLAAGAIYATNPSGDPPAVFCGSCGVYTRRDLFVTAAHCVPSEGALWIAVQGEQNARRVRQRTIHPTADLALLATDPPQSEVAYLTKQIFRRPENKIFDGADFICYGYPAEGSPDCVPVGRTIRGNIQREIIGYADNDNRRYMALEMSCPAPRGLSGSVLAYAVEPQTAVAVVTRNLYSYAIEDSIEEVQEGGQIYRNEIRRVITYGLACSLVDQLDWLDQQVAGLPTEAA